MTHVPIKPIPEGFHTVTPYLFAEGAPRLIEFISKAFHGEVILPQRAIRWLGHARYDAHRRLNADVSRDDQ
jgi:hypothetical protein